MFRLALTRSAVVDRPRRRASASAFSPTPEIGPMPSNDGCNDDNGLPNSAAVSGSQPKVSRSAGRDVDAGISIMPTLAPVNVRCPLPRTRAPAPNLSHDMGNLCDCFLIGILSLLNFTRMDLDRPFPRAKQQGLDDFGHPNAR